MADVRKKGTVWQLRWKDEHGLYHYESYPTKRLAKIRQGEIERATVERRLGVFKPITISFNKAAIIHLKHEDARGLSKRTLESKVRLFKQLRNFFKNSPVHSMSHKRIMGFFGIKAQDGVENRTKNRFYHALNVFFDWCIKNGYCSRNPLTQIRRFREHQPEMQWLREHEWKALRISARKSLVPYLPLAIDLGIFAGLRRSEILNLPITAVQGTDLIVANQKHWKTKSRRNRIIPIESELSKTLAQYKPHPNAMRLIHDSEGRPLTDIKKAVHGADKRAGLPKEKWGLHVLRHTFGMRMGEYRMQLKDLQELMGHSDPMTTTKYLHRLSLEEIRRIMG